MHAHDGFIPLEFIQQIIGCYFLNQGFFSHGCNNGILNYSALMNL